MNADKKEILLEDAIYQKIEGLKLSDVKTIRSPRVGKIRPDLILINSNGYFAVIEIKRSLENEQILERAVAMVQFVMNETKAKYGFVTDGVKTIFIGVDGKTSIIDDLYNHIKSLLQNGNPEKEASVSEHKLQELKDSLKKILDESEKRKEYICHANLRTFVNKLKCTDFTVNDTKISFSGEKEREFMQWLLGCYYKDNLCRYTSMIGLFRTLDSKRHSMVCLVGMNDKSEVDYVENYVGKDAFQSMSSSSSDNLNDLFILSCCSEDKEDDLTMFRLYGDDSRGVCLKYGIKGSYNDFFIAPVSYANIDGTHHKLDFLVEVSKYIQFNRFNVWQHFFKSEDYKVEEEVRVLYERKDVNVDKKWVNITSYGIICPIVTFDDVDFPLSLDKIILGSNTFEKDLNKLQIKTMADETGFVLKLGVDISKKNSYRVPNSRN